jgi:diguanylate cyclase (GGDEF)-like protein
VHSFKNRLLILVVSLMALAQGVTIVLALGSIRGAVRVESSRQLTATRAMLDRTLAVRARLLASATDVLVSDSAFREAVAISDRPTMQSALANHAARVSADLAVLYAPDGSVFAATTPGLAAQASRSLKLPADNAAAAPFAIVGGKPYQIVFAPVRAPLVIGWVALGFELDQRLARQLAALADTDVSFVFHEPQTAAAIISTLPAEQAQRLVSLVAEGARGADSAARTPGASSRTPGAESRTLGERDYLLLSAPLPVQGGALELVVQRSQAVAMAPFRKMSIALMLIGGAALLGAIFVALLSAQGAVRPLSVLVSAARQIQRGVYCEDIQVRGGDEFQHLAGAFNAMQEGIREREARILHQAAHDALTGLPNRQGLQRLLAQGEHHGPWSIALLDVQRFRDVNASLGHQAGDRLLRALSQRLVQAGLGQWPCARVGADQFVVFAPLHDSGLMHRLLVLADELRTGLAAGDLRQSLDVRIGICEWRTPRIAPEDLLRQADVALLLAKEQGEVAVTYAAAHDSEHRRRVLLVAELRRALVGESLSLHFQPLVNMTDRKAVAFEALLRWNHTTLGNIPPAEFIPLAERASVLPDLSRWVLRTAIQQLGEWQRAGIDVEIAVNLSAADFADGELPSRVLALLRDCQAPAHRLLLEVTESAIMRDPHSAAQVMQQLRLAGVRFAIDDFGTGHSSLAQLHALPVDELKIDRAFVHDLDRSSSHQVIVRTTVEMAHSLGLKVVAEGIETQEIWSALLRLGCDLGQGYYISRPMAAMQVPEWLARQREHLSEARSQAGNGGTVAAFRGRPA